MIVASSRDTGQDVKLSNCSVVGNINGTRNDNGSCFFKEQAHIIIIFGASGDLAARKLYPTLWALYRDNLLPALLKIYGYARSKLIVNDLKEKSRKHMNVEPSESTLWEKFWEINYYVSGQYDSAMDFEKFDQVLKLHEIQSVSNRIFYLAVPPSVYESVTYNIKQKLMGKKGWSRIVIEKPFGKDTKSYQKLSDHLASLFMENELFRVDHYLEKEMVQNIMTLRFANRILTPIWNRDNIASVLISFKESIGAENRGGYFDEYGIIRDIMQNHLLQILTLVAMEKPISQHPDDVRDEKVKVLRSIKPITIDETVLGQYVGNSRGQVGYLDDPSIPNNSKTPTFAETILHIDNERWDGIPFILKAGKALDEKKTEVRIQFKDIAGDIFEGESKRNELAIRVQPGEAIYIKLTIKTPGIAAGVDETELDLTYKNRYPDIKLPNAYELVIKDLICGTQSNFVRTDELEEAWRIFTPLLHQIEHEKITVINYEFGGRGPKEADELTKKYDFRHIETSK